ncbi:unnamed protein product [Phaedon cochleariae]|uniref:Regulatory protein zeste n=1 Tax=Phaedon cochleariae TaxID=80249 RepID=A0A9P0GMK4_PHACE|nr:unnamed protein product [Phaedon cochleariae]
MSDADEKKVKRARSSNYTQQEKNLLLNIILRFKHVVESKKTDAVTWRDKNSTWTKIATLFNSQSPTGTYRDVTSLRKVYENVKKTVRKTVSDEKVSFKKTGGGEASFNDDPTIDLALEVINTKTVYGLSNPFDSDCQGDKQEEETVQPYTEESFSCNAENVETVIIRMEDELDTPVDTVDWGDFKVSHLHTPVHSKLKHNSSKAMKTTQLPAEKEFSAATNEPEPSTSTSWSAKRRPITSALASSDISKKYIMLADLKIQIAKHELGQVEISRTRKEQQDKIEFELRKKSLELDIEIKEAILKKIDYLNPSDLISLMK